MGIESTPPGAGTEIRRRRGGYRAALQILLELQHTNPDRMKALLSIIGVINDMLAHGEVLEPEVVSREALFDLIEEFGEQEAHRLMGTLQPEQADVVTPCARERPRVS